MAVVKNNTSLGVGYIAGGGKNQDKMAANDRKGKALSGGMTEVVDAAGQVAQQIVDNYENRSAGLGIYTQA